MDERTQGHAVPGNSRDYGRPVAKLDTQLSYLDHQIRRLSQLGGG